MTEPKQIDPQFAKWIMTVAMLEGAALMALVAYFIFVDDSIAVLVSGVVTIGAITAMLFVRKLSAMREKAKGTDPFGGPKS